MFKKFRVFAASLLALILAISLSTLSSPAAPKGEPITLGYSNWAGWWPWAIAVDQKMFEKNGVNVQMKWFCLLYTSPSPRDISGSRMPSSA